MIQMFFRMHCYMWPGSWNWERNEPDVVRPGKIVLRLCNYLWYTYGGFPDPFLVCVGKSNSFSVHRNGFFWKILRDGRAILIWNFQSRDFPEMSCKSRSIGRSSHSLVFVNFDQRFSTHQFSNQYCWAVSKCF